MQLLFHQMGITKLCIYCTNKIHECLEKMYDKTLRPHTISTEKYHIFKKHNITALHPPNPSIITNQHLKTRNGLFLIGHILNRNIMNSLCSH